MAACADIDPNQLREVVALAVREATQRGRHADGNQTARGAGVQGGMHRPEDGAAIQAGVNWRQTPTIIRVCNVPGQPRAVGIRRPNQLSNIAAYPWELGARRHPNAVPMHGAHPVHELSAQLPPQWSRLGIT